MQAPATLPLTPSRGTRPGLATLRRDGAGETPAPPRCRTRWYGGVTLATRGAGSEARRKETGFTLLELAGVLGVLAILAAAVTPSLLSQIGAAAREREVNALSRLGQGLAEHVLANRRLPAPATMFGDLATTLGWPLAETASNAMGNARVLLMDPGLRLGSNTVANLPYVQGAAGVASVANARVLLLSSLGGALPRVIMEPGTNAATVFNLIWDTPDGVQPAGWTWGGNWSDLLVQRVNLRPLFTQVVLNNNSFNLGRYSIDNTNAPVPLPAPLHAAFYLNRTGLGLHGHTGDLQVLQVVGDLTADTGNRVYSSLPSYVYEQDLWRGRLFMGLPPPRRAGQDLQAAYEIFMSGPPNVYKVGGVNQSSVTWSMYVFMSNYVVWADSGFASSKKAAVTTAQSSMASQLGTYCNKKASAN